MPHLSTVVIEASSNEPLYKSLDWPMQPQTSTSSLFIYYLNSLFAEQLSEQHDNHPAHVNMMPEVLAEAICER